MDILHIMAGFSRRISIQSSKYTVGLFSRKHYEFSCEEVDSRAQHLYWQNEENEVSYIVAINVKSFSKAYLESHTASAKDVSIFQNIIDAEVDKLEELENPRRHKSISQKTKRSARQEIASPNPERRYRVT